MSKRKAGEEDSSGDETRALYLNPRFTGEPLLFRAYVFPDANVFFRECLPLQDLTPAHTLAIISRGNIVPKPVGTLNIYRVSRRINNVVRDSAGRFDYGRVGDEVVTAYQYRLLLTAREHDAFTIIPMADGYYMLPRFSIEGDAVYTRATVLSDYDKHGELAEAAMQALGKIDLAITDGQQVKAFCATLTSICSDEKESSIEEVKTLVRVLNTVSEAKGDPITALKDVPPPGKGLPAKAYHRLIAILMDTSSDTECWKYILSQEEPRSMRELLMQSGTYPGPLKEGAKFRYSAELSWVPLASAHKDDLLVASHETAGRATFKALKPETLVAIVPPGTESPMFLFDRSGERVKGRRSKTARLVPVGLWRDLLHAAYPETAPEGLKKKGGKSSKAPPPPQERPKPTW